MGTGKKLSCNEMPRICLRVRTKLLSWAIKSEYYFWHEKLLERLLLTGIPGINRDGMGQASEMTGRAAVGPADRDCRRGRG
jgi:hypothetical protein